MKSPAPAFATVTLLAAFCLPRELAQAQTISGNVSTPIGVPISGVTVTATRSFPAQRESDTTDASGNYTIGTRFGSDLDGTYTVQASSPGYMFTPASTNVTLGRIGDNAIANFTAPATAPTVETLFASNVLATSAMLVGRVRPNGVSTRVWWEYGTTTSYGTAYAPFSTSGNTFMGLATGLGNLSNNVTYHFRLVASNTFGVRYGEDQSFKTLSGVPWVTTLAPTDGGATSMRLNGAVNPNGASASSVWFEHGTTTNYGNVASVQPFGGGTNTLAFNQLFIGVEPGTTYHGRAAAATSFGTNYGEDVLFTPVFSDMGTGVTQVGYGSVGWADFNNDGRLDLLFNGFGAQRVAELWRNSPTGFVRQLGIPALPGITDGSMAWADYNNDGSLDFLLTGFAFPEPTTARALLFRNNGSGGFPAVFGFPPLYRSSVAWGDYDNDGRPDVLLAGLTTNGLPITQVWRNLGNVFDFEETILLPGLCRGAVAWADYNNDGRLDILLTGSTAASNNLPRTQLWRNTGSSFVLVNNAGLPAISGWNNRSSVAWGDYDNDGRLDLALAGLINETNYEAVAQVWRNTVGGFVLNTDAPLTPVFDGSVRWADYDNDGLLDILLTGSGPPPSFAATAQIWRNTGDGFVDIGAGLPGAGDGEAAWGDYDSDGRLDIFMTGVANARGQLWRNNTPKTNSPPTPPAGLRVTVTNAVATLAWDPSSDVETPADGLTYNIRIGTAPANSSVLAPASAANGLRRLPHMGNAQSGLTATFSFQLGRAYYWSVQALDSTFAGSAFSSSGDFKFLPVAVPVASNAIIPGDLDGDGVVGANELQGVLANYWADNPWLQMTNPAKLDEGFFQFALTNEAVWNYSVEVTTNLTDWSFLGPAFPVYQFVDPSSTNLPQRYYRLRWP